MAMILLTASVVLFGVSAVFVNRAYHRFVWFRASIKYRREAMELAGRVAGNAEAPMRARKFAMFLFAMAGQADVTKRVIQTAERIRAGEEKASSQSMLAELDVRWQAPLREALKNVAIAACLQDPHSAPSVFRHISRKHIREAVRKEERREAAIIATVLDRTMRERSDDFVCA